MEPIERILEVYRTADAEYRLNLFLENRDLRDRFASIDADGLRAWRTAHQANDEYCEDGRRAVAEWKPPASP